MANWVLLFGTPLVLSLRLRGSVFLRRWWWWWWWWWWYVVMTIMMICSDGDDDKIYYQDDTWFGPCIVFCGCFLEKSIYLAVWLGIFLLPLHCLRLRNHFIVVLLISPQEWCSSKPDSRPNDWSFIFLPKHAPTCQALFILLILVTHGAWRQFVLHKNKQRFCFSQVVGFDVKIPNK